MARVNVYLPDELAAQARRVGLNVSSVAQEALSRTLAGRQSNDWLDALKELGPTDVGHDEVIAAIASGRDDFDLT